MIVNLVELKRVQSDSNAATEWVDQIVDNAHKDPPYLSSLLASQKGGEGAALYVMEALHAKYIDNRDMPPEMRTWWTLKMIVDDWGNTPRPGDTELRRIQMKLRHGKGKPITSSEESVDIMNGEWEKKWIKHTPYKVDKKGCIRCEFKDAAHFLLTMGVHGKSGNALCQHVKPHTDDPAPAPNGQLLHKHYYRFKEVDAAEYDALPTIKKTDEPKRGIDPMDKIREWEVKKKAEIEVAKQKTISDIKEGVV
jgi:hypothetical protein